MGAGRQTLQIGPLLGGGLVLGYGCPARCRHCLYGCGPHRQDGLGRGAPDLERVLDLLARRAPRARLHIGGGEPFSRRRLLTRAVAGLRRRGLTLEYVETNAGWARDRRHAEEVLSGLAREGLPCVLVSLSPFHAEHVPPARTEALIQAAQATLPGGAFVWIPGFRADLQGQDPDQRLDLDRLLARRGDPYARQLAARYSLVPAGRAGRYLHQHGQRRPWREVARHDSCAARWADTSHFHVDLTGAYVPGLCAGLTLPLERLPGDLELGGYPLLAALAQGGPAALVELAAAEGFVPAETYSSPCDLCGHARAFLHPRGAYPELGPAGYYDPRSVDHGPTAPGPLAEDPAELLEVVDRQGRVLGLRTRGEVHADAGLIHRAVHVVVSNAAGDIFLQKRSLAKAVQPGRWDTSVGGHVDPGEGYLEAARRELAEELGVHVARGQELVRRRDYLWECPSETELVRSFSLRHEGPFALHPTEIDDGRFWSREELKVAAGTDALTPNLEHELDLSVLGSSDPCEK